jgi:chloramphenicol O-acetyltransferase type A
MKTEIKKELIDIENWSRKEHFRFFSKFEEPFFGLTARVDCTKAYKSAKEKNTSVFLYYLYRALKTANEIENFRYRIIEKKVYEFNIIHGSPTINRPDGTFGFSYIDYFEEEKHFLENAHLEIEKVKKSRSLMPAVSGENVIHFSAIPWIDFTSISHARSFSHADSCPKISFGKITDIAGIKSMPVSIHVHHGLMDAYHVSLFMENFQELLNE